MAPGPGRVVRHRRRTALLLAAALAIGAGVSPIAIRPALAAGPLRVQADASYVLDPDAGRVHVSIDFELTNLKPSTSTTFFYYTSYLVGIQPDATNIRATDASGALTLSTSDRRFFTRVDVSLRSFLYYRQSTRFTLRYDLAGGKPRSPSFVRVGKAFATFGVWSWGDPGRSSVSVKIPAGYASELEGGPMRVDPSGSGETLEAEPDDPDTFYAIVSAENPAAYTTERISLEGDIELVVRGWPEDTRWQDSVTEALRSGMPELVDLIGLDWPVTHDLEVLERYTPALEGYAGVFLTEEERIEVTEDLDPLTIMHEASHAWFNESLFGERWIYEGLAEEYSWRVQTTVGGPAGFGARPPEDDDPGRVALDVWAYPQVIREVTNDLERYGYGASFYVVHQIVEAAGVEHMRGAFDAAEHDLTAYVGAGTPEKVPAGDDWRRFLDLAEPIDQEDSPAVEAAIKDIVLTKRDASVIDRRHDARVAYRELLAAGEGWLPPWYVRRHMSEWSFVTAERAMGEAQAVLTRRAELEAAGSALGLAPSDALRRAYESATDSFDAASAIADDELEALGAIEAARAQVEAPVDLVAQLGLLGGAMPADSYAAARAAFESGDLAGSIAAAGTASDLVAGAAAAGQQRLLIGLVIVGALVLLLALLVARRRRRGTTAPLMAAPAAAVAPEPAPFGAPAEATPPEPAWWLPTRAAADASPTRHDPVPVGDDPAPGEPSGTLAPDPVAPLPPPAANPPDQEGGPP